MQARFATPWDLQFTIYDLQFGELGAAKPRDNVFHLAKCQMKLTRDRAERRGWMRAS